MNSRYKKIYDILLYSQEVTNLEHFILYGCSPIDMMLGKKFNDIDLATKGIEKQKIKALNRRFKEKNFDIAESGRPYSIRNGTVNVILVYARGKENFFDVCFMNDPTLVGLFNVESLYWRYPELDCIDNYNALEGVASKTITPIISLDSENPLYFFSRFIRLCSKYNIPIIGNKEHHKTIDSINTKLNNIDFTSYYSQYSSALSSLFKSIIQAEDRSKFIDELVESGFIHSLLPEIIGSLKTLDRHLLTQVDNRCDLIKLIRESLNEDYEKIFCDKIKCLESRTWKK